MIKLHEQKPAASCPPVQHNTFWSLSCDSNDSTTASLNDIAAQRYCRALKACPSLTASPEDLTGLLANCRSLNELKQAREAELEARGEPSDAVSFSDFPEQSSAFIVHHTSILRNKRLLLIYT